MEPISKNHLKNISRLSSKKFRLQEVEVIVEGLRTIKHLAEHEINLLELYLTDPALGKNFKAGKIYLLDEHQLARITSTKNPQNIAALVAKQNIPLTDHKFVLYLDQINEPGNLGTIIRTAEAAGVSGVILSPHSCSIYNPKTIRASMGSVFTLPIQIRNVDWLEKSPSRKIASTVDNALNLFEFSRPAGDITLIIGSEAHGIRQEILELCDESVMIPLTPNVESLNAAVAAGIIIYHFLK
jgi:TrmH family RNA methyltransferase